MPKTRDLPSKKEEECARKKLIELLKIKEDKIQHSNSEYNGLHVHDHEFDFFALQELLNFEFKYEIVFINCKFKDIESFNTYETKHNFLIFQKCKFDSKIIESDLTVQNVSILNNKFLFFACEFNGNIDIGKVTFSDEIKFSDCSFKDMVKLDIKASLNNIEFDSCLFEKEVDLQGSIFEKEVYFTNCYFKNTTNFSHCKFKNIASFYNSTFEKVPNFSASYFKEQKAVNLINVNVDKISFKSIEKYVENNYKKDKYYKKELEEIKSNENKNKLKQKLDKKYKLKCIKNIKDSFKNIKDVLISQSNILEVQEWHKLELYTMEKEYDIKLEFEKIQDNINIFSNILIWFNCILLNIYRNTSNHHTNFLKIFHFTIGAVSLYATFCYLIYNFFEQSHTFLLYILTKDFFGFKVVYYILFVFIILCTIMMLLYQNKNNIFTYSLLFVVVYICLYFFYGILPYCLISLNFRELFFFVSVYILSMFLYYIIFLYFQRYLLLNFIFKLFLYLTFLFVFISTPQLLNPLLGVFSSDKLYESKFEKYLNELNSSSVSKILDIMQENFENKNSDFNMTFTELNSAKDYIKANKNIIIEVNLTKAKNIMPNYENIAKSAMQDELAQGAIKSTSILYTIILLLCIFSLQKTARKNSIVPN